MGVRPPHGGARKGAGRKALPADQQKVKMSFKLATDVAALLKENRPMSKTIENAVREYLSKKTD